MTDFEGFAIIAQVELWWWLIRKPAHSGEGFSAIAKSMTGT